MMDNPFLTAFGSDLSLTSHELTVVWRPKATCSKILKTTITSDITTTQQNPPLAQGDYPSAVQGHQTPECDRAYGPCPQCYSSNKDKKSQ